MDLQIKKQNILKQNFLGGDLKTVKDGDSFASLY